MAPNQFFVRDTTNAPWGQVSRIKLVGLACAFLYASKLVASCKATEQDAGDA